MKKLVTCRRLALFTFVLGAASARAQDVAVVAKNHYTVLLDNAYVRVIENTLKPGEKDPMHTHPAGWFYVTQPGTMKVVHGGGRVEMWEAKADRRVVSPVGLAQITEVADARACEVILFLRQAAFHPRDLEREAGRGGDRMREDVCGAGERHRQDELLVACVEARLVTEGERRPDLDPRGAGHERFLETLGRAVSAREPERKPQFTQLREIDGVSLPVNRLARRGELEAGAGRRVVASRR